MTNTELIAEARRIVSFYDSPDRQEQNKLYAALADALERSEAEQQRILKIDESIHRRIDEVLAENQNLRECVKTRERQLQCAVAGIGAKESGVYVVLDGDRIADVVMREQRSTTDPYVHLRELVPLDAARKQVP